MKTKFKNDRVSEDYGAIRKEAVYALLQYQRENKEKNRRNF